MKPFVSYFFFMGRLEVVIKPVFVIGMGEGSPLNNLGIVWDTQHSRNGFRCDYKGQEPSVPRILISCRDCSPAERRAADSLGEQCQLAQQQDPSMS